MAEFFIATLSPLPCERSDSLTAARATVRAGGVALVDLDPWPALDPTPWFEALIGTFTERARSGLPGVPIGFRFAACHSARFEALAAATGVNGVDHWCMVSNWSDRSSLPSRRTNRTCWLEITDLQDLARADEAGLRADGWLARGAETGGPCATESVFVLAQALAGQQRRFLMQGGLGIRGCVAARVAGACGVVLDDALLLLDESAVRAGLGDALHRLGGEDTVSIGEDLGLPVRVVPRADLPAARALLAHADELIAAAGPVTERREQWRQAVADTVGWGESSQSAWPVGEGIGMARIYAARFRTVGRFLGAVGAAVGTTGLRALADADILAADNALAQTHRTRYPVVQGPMTRVSDSPQFAVQVAEQGGLPLIALATLAGSQAQALLEECAVRLQGRSWGVGVLGFLDKELLDEQLRAVAQTRPPFVLLAGGRPDQAKSIEESGAVVYLHVPTPTLLRAFLAQGARHFVFEGAECGGHAGPLHSLPLWEAAVETLLTQMPAGQEATVHALFAGGIHDALSAAMAAAVAAPLVERGVRFGVLMGTGYLFTTEAVACGAIVPEFQKQALDCARTARLRTGPGHVVQCAQTPFVDRFQQSRIDLFRSGVPHRDIATQLEAMMLGRSRAAAKGYDRDAGGDVHLLDADEQRRRGVYMMGQVAVLRDRVQSLAQLHRDVSEGSVAWLRTRFAQPQPAGADPGAGTDMPVAIVGAACLLPGAHSVDAFWRNVLAKTSFVREIPAERFDWRLYFDADPSAADKIYSKWGAFLDKLAFDPTRFGIPPNSLKSISVAQLLTLEAARRALDDAGYAEGAFDRENTAVVLGTDGMADLYHGYIARSMLPSLITTALDDAYARLPAWTEESFSGILSNVAAGRVANRLDLRGPNYSVDAACASSLAALQLGIRELERGDSSVALVIGAEFDQNPYGYLAFSKTKALSPSGRARPFDRDADGIVIGEGVVALVLRRLVDAERDGDRIYAVVRSVAGSSDGKAMSLTAPRSEGQQLAFRRAYTRAGVSAATLGMYEAHGTGTAVGDRTELLTAATALSEAGAQPQQCVLGSTKGLIGHTKAAAGLAGVLKAALALHHRTLPPHGPIDAPLSDLALPQSPMRVLDKPQPWMQISAGPRRAGVSAFGFGGTNFHAVLEEYDRPLVGPAAGAAQWPAELFATCADDPRDLIAQLEALQRAARLRSDLPLRDLAWSFHRPHSAGAVHRVAFVASDGGALESMIDKALQHLQGGQEAPPSGVYSGHAEKSGELAFLFPGQGSQFPGMGADLAVYLIELRQALESLEHYPQPTAGILRDCLLPSKCFNDESRHALARALQATDVAQPALAMVSAGLLAFLHRLGIRPAAVAGHSYGEFAALHAAGVYTRETLFRLSAARGDAMAAAAESNPGAMAAVDATREDLLQWLEQCDGVTFANHNGPRQCVIAGDVSAVDAALADLSQRRIASRRLAVGAAFHSAAMRPASAVVSAAIRLAQLTQPSLPVYSNVSGDRYPANVDALREQLERQLESPVEFVRQVENLYAAGARVFVEVGPKQVLCGLVGKILEGKPHVAVALHPEGGSMPALLAAIAQLFAAGVTMDVAALFAGRSPRKLSFDALAPEPAVEWYMDGGGIWPASQPPGHIGRQPLLTLESAAQQRSGGGLPDSGGHAALDAYTEYQRTMRSFLEAQERTLGRFLQGLDGQAHAEVAFPSSGAVANVDARADAATKPPKVDGKGNGVLSVRAAEPHLSAPTESGAEHVTELTLAGLTAMFTGLIAERTGYALAAIRPELDLEAELGVDSIKRIEVLAKAEDGLPGQVREAFRRSMDRLTQTRTVDGLARAVLALRGAPASTPSAVAKTQAPPVPCQRSIMRAHAAPIAAPSGTVPGGFYWVTGSSPLAQLMIRRLQACGAEVEWISSTQLEDAAAIKQRIDQCKPRSGHAAAIVHLAGLDTEFAEASTESLPGLARWQQLTRRCVESLFHLLRDSAGAPRVLAATGFGGQWGRGAQGIGGTLRAASGGIHGVVRTYAAETGGVATVVDVDPLQSDEVAAERLLAELMQDDASYAEVGYVHGERHVFVAEAAPLTLPGGAGWTPQPGAVVLVTGGARGITALAAEWLALPGVRLIIVGRSALADADDGSPQAREKRDMLANLQARGAEVQYHAVDVSSEDAFGGLIDDLYRRFGRIDAVVHGAGIIEDKLIADKKLDSFRRVFATKADSAFVLRTRLRAEHLKCVVLFGSVSGRFGNLGQVDYAAGNELMNRLAWDMAAAWPRARVVCVNWGPWSGTGMASAAVLQRLESRGIHAIPVEAGRRFLIDEIQYGDGVEVVAGVGPWMVPPPGAAQSANSRKD